jgi:hypothetical protein
MVGATPNQYASKTAEAGDEGDIIIGTTAISSGRILYSADRFQVAAVWKSGGRAVLVPGNADEI